MAVFYLIRHGEKEEMIGDAALSLAGRVQAYATARYLQDRPIKSVYTSPLRRAKETAVLIASAHELFVVEDIRLRERVNWGDLPGQSLIDFVAMWERSTLDPEYSPLAGDSARQAGERMELFLRETAHKHPRDEIVAVTHGRDHYGFSGAHDSAGTVGAMAPQVSDYAEQPHPGMFDYDDAL